MGFIGFLKKEFKEIVRTQKVIILSAIFLVFGISSPLFAKEMPNLLKSAVEGIEIKIPEPQFFDAYVQFYKNLTQIGIIVMILTFMGMVVDEKVRGSVILVLTKGVTRTQFILSKLLASSFLFIGAFALGALACIYYTYLLFPKVYNENIWLSMLCFVVYGLLMLSITMFASTISKSHVISAVTAFAGYAAVSAASFLPKLGKYLPGTLSDLSTKLMQETKNQQGTLVSAAVPGDALVPMIVTIALIIALIVSSILIFRKQEL